MSAAHDRQRQPARNFDMLVELLDRMTRVESKLTRFLVELGFTAEGRRTEEMKKEEVK